MMRDLPESRMHQRLINSLYTETMLLADEARGYFDDQGCRERATLSQLARITFSCESLKVTTRLMHSIAWLLTWRAVLSGDLPQRKALDPSRRLGQAPTTEPEAVARLPADALALVRSSERLHNRIARLDQAQASLAPPSSPVRSMHDRLVLAF